MYVEEIFVSAKNSGLKVDSQYYKQRLKGSLEDVYLRETVMQKLVAADFYLRTNCNLCLVLWDGYRTYKLQKTLYDKQYEILKNNYPDKTDNELKEMMKAYVSLPTKDVTRPFVHNTGGAIDLTLADMNGNCLDMGSDFDEFSERSKTDYYEKNDDNLEARKNRRILYEVMTSLGFTNLSSEWWHYDYGDKFWAEENEGALYRGADEEAVLAQARRVTE